MYTYDSPEESILYFRLLHTSYIRSGICNEKNLVQFTVATWSISSMWQQCIIWKGYFVNSSFAFFYLFLAFTLKGQLIPYFELVMIPWYFWFISGAAPTRHHNNLLAVLRNSEDASHNHWNPGLIHCYWDIFNLLKIPLF